MHSNHILLYGSNEAVMSNDNVSVLAEMRVKKTNPEKLIRAVKKHPCIWNNNCPEYKRKKAKQAAWNTVASEVVNGWNDFNRTEKHLTVRYIFRRWNNIRDSYNKSLRASCLAKLKGDTSDKKKYVYADALKFLKPALKQNMNLSIRELNESVDFRVEDLQSDSDGEDDQDIEDEDREAVQHETVVNTENGVGSTAATRGDSGSSSSQEEDVEYDEVANTKTKQGEDTDLKFLKSLLPDMKKLSDKEKFKFKYAIMQAYMGVLKK